MTVHLEFHKHDGKLCHLWSGRKSCQHLGYSREDQRCGNICKIVMLSCAGQDACILIVHVTEILLFPRFVGKLWYLTT